MSQNQKIKIYNPITNKDTKIDPYGRTAKKIYKYMFETVGAPPEDILPDDLTYLNGRFIKVKPAVSTSNVRRITYNQVKATYKKADDNSMSYLRKVMKSYKGQTVKLVARYTDFDFFVDDDELLEKIKAGKASALDKVNIIAEREKDETFTVPHENFSKWWDANSHFFWLNSDTELFGEWNDILKDDPKLQSQLLILTLDKVKEQNFDQYFLDGITHCVFTPIKDWAIDCLENSKSKSAQKRYKTICKKIDNYVIKYSKGVPEKDISEICNDLQISIDIDLPSTARCEDKFIEIESQKKALKKFKFINTRLNHIELNKVNTKDNYEAVSKEEIKAIFKQKTESGEFILWKESMTCGITQINALDKIYKLETNTGYMKAVNDFEDDYNIRSYAIEKNSNKQLTDFLYDSVNCNQTMTFVPQFNNKNSQDYALEAVVDYLNNDKELYEKHHTKKLAIYDEIYNDKKTIHNWIDKIDDLNHIDIRKAYTQGHNCSMYQGYLGKITDFRICDKIVGLGIYKIKNINFNGCFAIEKMKCLHENQSYPSPELEFYKKLGITFDITMGCWGSKFDMQFPASMLEKEDGLSHYCKWYGCLMKFSDYERYTFNCKNLDFAKLNAYHAKSSSIRYNYGEETGIVEYPRKYQYHHCHLASFIASYSRITMLEQILKFKDFNQIYSVVVDGIYYTGDVEVGPLFSDKEKKSLKNNLNCDEYVHNVGKEKNYSNIGKFREDNRLEVHLGAGGCGKTHNNLVDKGLVNPLFIAPSWKLARNKKKEYGIDSTTFFHLLDEDPDRWRLLYRNYSNFVIDEISMLSNEDKEKLIKRYPQHKIIFCGDIGYQLPPIEGSEFKIGDIPVVHHKTNYRCECADLQVILNLMRKYIEIGLFGNNYENFIKKLGFSIIDEKDMDYNVNDMIICSTHKQKDKYTKKYKHLEKYTVLENCRDFSNGDIVIGSKPEKVRCELRHAYTVHSVQGETAKNKLFIDIRGIRDMKMLYTAVSRCKRFDQIQFVKSK